MGMTDGAVVVSLSLWPERGIQLDLQNPGIDSGGSNSDNNLDSNVNGF